MTRHGNFAATDPLVVAFRKVVDQLSISLPQTPLISNLTGRPAGEEIKTSDYWCRQLLEPVRFADGVQALAEACDRFLELSPRPVLLPLARRILHDDSRFKSPGCWLDGLRPQPQDTPRWGDDWSQVLSALSELYRAGLDVDWTAFYEDAGRRRVVLPTYPFERKRFWIDRPPVPSSATRSKKRRLKARRSLLPAARPSEAIENTTGSANQQDDDAP